MRYCFTILTTLLLGPAYGQIADSVFIDSLYINASPLRNAEVGSIQKEIPSESTHSLPGTLNGIGLYIKSYGDGSLASSTIRGGSASQTQVLWNGIPIQSPTLGQLDLSLIPTEVSETIGLSYGGLSTYRGSGAVTGAILLDNKAPITSSLKLNTTLGSFGYKKHSLMGNYATTDVSTSTKVIYNTSNRDFPYTLADGTKKIQSHAEYDRLAVTQDIYIPLTSDQIIEGHLWYNDASTEIPSTTVQNNSEAYQDDRSLRSTIKWKLEKDRSNYSIQVGYIHEDNNYFDPLIRLKALNSFKTLFIDAEHSRKLYNHSFNIAMTMQRNTATSGGYSDLVCQTRYSLQASDIIKWKSIRLQPAIRLQYVRGKVIPLMPNVGASWKVNDNIEVKGKVSKDFKLPTLNDSYWEPGGNLDVRPESGWSEELSFIYTTTGKKVSLHTTATIYNRIVDDWIMWAPDKNKGYWSAQNINKVWSRGLDLSLKSSYDLTENGKLSSSLNYAYTKSTSQVALELPKIAKGDQLFYTPEHQASIRAQYTYNMSSLTYHQSLFSSTRGLNQTIDSYTVAGLNLSQGLKYRKQKALLFININNLWDNNYYIIERRPVPGRHYNFGITVHLK